MMRRLLGMCGAILLGASIIPAQQTLTLQVQVHYTGSGTVDATHKVFVALWDSPDTNGPPVLIKSTSSKDGTVIFSDIQKAPVYVATAYDATGKWDGQSGPPPSGASLGMNSKAPPTPDPVEIAPGKTAKVTISFDDSVKAP